MVTPRKREGIAIFLVVMITGIIGVFVAVMIFQRQGSTKHLAIKLEKNQATYLAQGAHQHFLLKFKLLPTELYDAVSYAVGKNPYFDFSARVESVPGDNSFKLPNGKKPDRGPMFFTGSQGRTQVSIDPASKRLVINRSTEGDNMFMNPAAGFSGSVKENRDRMEVLLNHYLLDIATGYPNVQDPIVSVDSETHVERARMGKDDGSQGDPEPWRDPFTGDYSVVEIRVLGIGGGTAGRKYQADSVLLTTEASVAREGQISLIPGAAGGEPVKLQGLRVSDTALEDRGGWVDANEKGTDFALRQQGADGKSARRTDIATNVYFISRKAK